MEHKLTMIGVVRFSVLTPTYYSERFDTLKATAAHLFSPERMELRFRYFEKLCLPSLVRQSDRGFQCVVLTAAALPGEYVQRLRALLDPWDHIHYLPMEPDLHYQMLKRAYDSVDCGDATHRIMFRLDDDDAVDLGFVSRTKRLAKNLQSVSGPEEPVFIAYNRGIYIRRHADGENEVYDACERAPLSTGLIMVARKDDSRNPYRFNHRAIGMHANTYTDISTPGFIRTIHGDNKSKPGHMGLTRKQRPRVIARQLDEHFGQNVEDLRAL